MRRGVIEMTTTAIVTIVIAAVVLVLLIVFIAASFGPTSQRFIAQSESYMTPAVATEANPLTIAAIEAPDPGEEFTLGVSVYNAGPQASNVRLNLTCQPGTLDGGLLSSSRVLPARSSINYVAVGKIAQSAPSGSRPCVMRAVADDGVGRVIAESDYVLTVQ
jgi:hypothetical protein